MPVESDPLLLQSPGSQRYYFLNKSDPSYTGGTTVTDAGDAGQVVEGPPPNSLPEEFAPRSVGKHMVRARARAFFSVQSKCSFHEGNRRDTSV